MDEFEIIRRFFVEPITFKNDSIVIGPGDDCAVVRIPDGYELCVSTDTLLEGVHFPVNASADMVVSRALGANLSDLAAMGAQTHGFTLALTLPGSSEIWLSAFSARLNTMIELYQLPLLGGNLTKGQLSLTLNIMGIVPVGTSLLRTGAQPGDDVYVSGDLGDAAGGLELVLKSSKSDIPGDNQTQLISRYSEPVPRLLLGQGLRGLASAAIDISDGFVADLEHLCRAGDVGAQIALDSLPVSRALLQTFGREKALTLAIQGGDDYELCFTVPGRLSEVVATLALSVGCRLTKVGKITTGQTIDILDEAGIPVRHTGGYRHF